jgi:hypothetical protein
MDNASMGNGRMAAPDIAIAKAGIETAKNRRDLTGAGLFALRLIASNSKNKMKNIVLNRKHPI